MFANKLAMPRSTLSGITQSQPVATGSTTQRSGYSLNEKIPRFMPTQGSHTARCSLPASTTASSGTGCAGAGAPATAPANSATPAATRIRARDFIPPPPARTPASSLPSRSSPSSPHRARSPSCARTCRSGAPPRALHRERALGEFDLVAILQQVVRAAGLERDVLVAEQPLGVDRRGRIGGQREALVHLECHARAQLVVELDLAHLAHRDAGHRHGR